MATNIVLFDWDASNVGHLGRHDVAPKDGEERYRNDPLVLEEQLIGGEIRY